MLEDKNSFANHNAGQGLVAPADGNAPGVSPAPHAFATTPEGMADLGSNFEHLEDARPDLVNALRELVRQYRAEGITSRRNEIRRIRQARLFWQGTQYSWWNPTDLNWHVPYE